MSAALLTDSTRLLGRRAKILVLALAATVVGALGMAAGPVPSASAWTYCPNVTLGPNGQCHLPIEKATDLKVISSWSEDRAHCTALLGYYGEQLDSWVCAPKGQYAWYLRPEWRPSGYYRAAIKNNNLTQSGQFTGFY